jgi:N-methylhydantoinase B/oxoprolinase/acetone carboxylase alpha subunit
VGAPAAATLSIFHHLFTSVAEEMGLTLERTAYSPNIKERLDFSCAVFLGDGRMLAQAAHIPVHLGAMPDSVRAAIENASPFAPGDVVILNDPYLGGTHLPDITMVSPVFAPGSTVPDFFVASRAHHSDVGGMVPGSMPRATELYQEGLIIPPVKLMVAGIRNEGLWQMILRNVRTPDERAGDISAQLAAHTIGAARMEAIRGRYGLVQMVSWADALIGYSKDMTEVALRHCPEGTYTFLDCLDDDGHVSEPVSIRVMLNIAGGRLHADFAGSAPAVRGNLNAVPAVVRSAVAYCVRCITLALVDSQLPMNEGAFLPICVSIPAGSVLDPLPPHAVAAGNVETSQRIVDVVFGALAQALPELIPAASQGTMNNISFGGSEEGKPFAYYETIGGGAGAGPAGSGGSGLHVHMSNTRNTPVEALEHEFPLRVERYQLRQGSGGKGKYTGGDGLVRSLRFLAPVTVTLTGERRIQAPYGLRGGSPGTRGADWVDRDETREQVTGKATIVLEAGDLLTIETPGGGGWGEPTF